MIWRPKVGQRVELRYGKRWREAEFIRELHGQRGTVRIVARGPGPVNVFVELDKSDGDLELARAGCRNSGHARGCHE
jgi:hypothetical protein